MLHTLTKKHHNIILVVSGLDSSLPLGLSFLGVHLGSMHAHLSVSHNNMHAEKAKSIPKYGQNQLDILERLLAEG